VRKRKLKKFFISVKCFHFLSKDLGVMAIVAGAPFGRARQDIFSLKYVKCLKPANSVLDAEPPECRPGRSHYAPIVAGVVQDDATAALSKSLCIP